MPPEPGQEAWCRCTVSAGGGQIEIGVIVEVNLVRMTVYGSPYDLVPEIVLPALNANFIKADARVWN